MWVIIPFEVESINREDWVEDHRLNLTYTGRLQVEIKLQEVIKGRLRSKFNFKNTVILVWSSKEILNPTK